MTTPTPTGRLVSIRSGPRPGDLGRVLTMHGELYAQEYDFDERFEAHVAQGLAGFATALGEARDRPEAPEPGRLWVAERDGEVVGTVGLTDEGGGVGQLRWFLVTPHVRGHGVGGELVQALLAHARDRGMSHIKLWTVDVLHAAARLYLGLGFRCTERHPTRKFGHDLAELRYDLDLR
jgi:N-acetylglutamate synthase-like GNAT family acetyltransferase